MKRSVLILFFVLILGIFIIRVIAQEDFGGERDGSVSGALEINPETGLPYEVDKTKDIGEKLKDEEQREFLRKEWSEKIEQSFIFEKIQAVNPVFKIILGMEFSLSWLFVLTLVLWIFFVVYAFRILGIFSLIAGWLKFVILIGLIGLNSWFVVTAWISEWIINQISLMSSWWMQLIGALVVIVALVVACVFSKSFENLFKRVKERQEKTAEELNREKLKQDVKISGVFAKGINKGLSG